MIEIKNFHCALNGRTILQHINYTQQLTGKLIGVLGPNGAGKSTLFKGILGFIHSNGTVHLDNHLLKYQLTRCAYIPQKSALDIDFPITVIDAIRSGAYTKGHLTDSQSSARNNLKRLMTLMELQSIKHKLISELSGGQLQRVLIARSLMQEKDIYFLDEPFVGIDFNSYEIIKNRLFDLRKNNKLIFIIHHDLNTAANLFDECILLNKEIIASGFTSEVLTDDNIRKTFLVQGGENDAFCQ